MSVFLVLACYLIVVAAIGYAAYRHSLPSTEDYFLQSRGVGTFALALTLFATIASAFFYLGIAGAMSVHGLPFMVVGLWQFLTVFAILYVGTRVWKLGRTFGHVTPADLLAHYYEDSKVVRAVVPLVAMIGAFPFMILQMRGAGLSLEILTGGTVGASVGIFLFTVLALAYVVVGGVRAVIWTDVFQGLYFAGLLVVIAVLMIVVIIPEAGIASVWQRQIDTAPEMLTFPGGSGAYSWPLMFSLVVMTGLGNIGQPAVFQRFFMARSKATIRASAILYLLIITPLIYLLLYLTLAGNQLATPSQPDMLFPTVLAQHAPILAGFFIAGVIAAGMSTVDSLLISLSSMITIDYADKLLGRRLSQAQSVQLGRIFVVVISLVAFVMALYSPAALADLALLQVGFASCMVVPVLGPLFWRRASTAGAIAALFAGPIAVALFAWVFGRVLGFNENFWGPAIGLAAFVLVSLATPAVASERRTAYADALARRSGTSADEGLRAAS